MQVGDLVRIPEWQKKRNFWTGISTNSCGIVLEITPYAVHVMWDSGDCLAHKTKAAEQFEVVKQ